MYWCEGGKNEKFGIHFTNSDPYLVKTFLYFLRRGYKLKENKLKVCIHLHEYHDVKKQLAFWSQTTKIPKGQFVKPYIKPHTGKVVRENYQGCISIRYYSTDLARKILMLGKACIHVFGGMV